MLSTHDENPGERQGSDQESRSRRDSLNAYELDSMMPRFGWLDDKYDPCTAKFYGAASGFAFLHKTQDFFANNMNDDEGAAALKDLFDAPLPPSKSVDVGRLVNELMPPKEEALELTRAFFAHSNTLFQFLEENVVLDMANRLYDLDPDDFEDADHAFLPLYNLILGLGCLYDQRLHRAQGCRKIVSEAYVPAWLHGRRC